MSKGLDSGFLRHQKTQPCHGSLRGCKKLGDLGFAVYLHTAKNIASFGLYTVLRVWALGLRPCLGLEFIIWGPWSGYERLKGYYICIYIYNIYTLALKLALY